jgi:hypothetical protein
MQRLSWLRGPRGRFDQRVSKPGRAWRAQNKWYSLPYSQHKRGWLRNSFASVAHQANRRNAKKNPTEMNYPIRYKHVLCYLGHAIDALRKVEKRGGLGLVVEVAVGVHRSSCGNKQDWIEGAGNLSN